MMNVVMWSHENICVDFQQNNKDSSFCFRYPSRVPRDHSLECKSALIGMISPELCDSGICKFGEWLLYIGLAKVFDLALNLAAMLIAGLEYGRYIYGSELQLLQTDGSKFYRTLRFIKLGLIITGAVICIVIPYFGGKFEPVANELVDMGCLRHVSSTARGIGSGMTLCFYIQMLSPLAQVTQDLMYNYYVARRGQRYMRLPTSTEPARGFNRGSGLPTSIEPAYAFITRRVHYHFCQMFLYLLLTFWGLLLSAMELSHWGYDIQSARDLAESTTIQGVGDWCFYCPGDEPIVQLGAHVAVKYIAWSLVILNAMASLSILVVFVCDMCGIDIVGCVCRNNPCCVLPDCRDR